MKLDSVAEVEAALRADSYLPDRGLATAIYLALAMRRPLLLEGEPGVGKTEVGKTLARVLGAELVRLQCYEGIDASQALYEWDYSRQLLATRTESGGAVDLYGPEFLVERRCCGRSGRAPAPCCSSTSSIARTTSSRRSCSRSSPTSASRFRSSGGSRPPSRRRSS